MSEKRDTQFAGFAKALWAELEANIEFIPEGQARRAKFLPMVEGIIARRAYDLVDHAVSWINPLAFQSHTDPINAIITETPDLPELPQAD